MSSTTPLTSSLLGTVYMCAAEERRQDELGLQRSTTLAILQWAHQFLQVVACSSLTPNLCFLKLPEDGLKSLEIFTRRERMRETDRQTDSETERDR